jgi:solute:Na+ symporter, SSS family
MHWIDYIIIIGFLILIIAIGLSYTGKGSKNLVQFFLGGRNLPWYIAGISMVATTFAADTPLAVTELIGDKGISGNWLWWNFLIGGMLTTFFFAKLWRKANVLTEVELIELRYSGKPARFLRGFKSLYLGVFMNVLIMGWVNLAMLTILQVFFDLSRQEALLIIAALLIAVAIYSSLSGLLGVVITDAIQFVIAMAGSIILAIVVVKSDAIGGIGAMKSQLMVSSPHALDFFPQVGEHATNPGNQTGTVLALGIGSFLAYMTVQWWASWYPGAEPGGGGYIAQRMMSTKNEKHAVYSTLFFQIAHYCIRPWPWIIVGLSAIVLYGNYQEKITDDVLLTNIHGIQTKSGVKEDLVLMDSLQLMALAGQNDYVKQNLQSIQSIRQKVANSMKDNPILNQSVSYAKDKRKGYVFIMKDFLPVGLKGLLLAAFFAAFMSTISTQLNWGSSYVVNDFYKRFIYKKDNQKHLILVSRMVTIVLMFMGLGATQFMSSISGVWSFILECGAGLGAVLILRWYWWRINAWSEITATIVPFIVYGFTKFYFHIPFPESFFYTVGITCVAWIAITYITQPTSKIVLQNFYDRVEPDGWWKPFRKETSTKENQRNLVNLLVCWMSGIGMTYSILFLMGKFILLEWKQGIIFSIAAVLFFIVLKIFIRKTKVLS